VRAYLLMMAIAAVVTYLATHAVRRYAAKRNLHQAIRERDSHSTPTPRLGGVAMYFGFLATILIAWPLGWFSSVFANPGQVIAIVVSITVIALVGVLDDLYDLDWTLKLAAQFIVGGVLAWQGVQIVSLPISGLTIGSFGTSLISTVLITVLVMNAVNFIDGLDGLVAGVVLIGTSVFFAYTYLLAQQTSPTDYFSLSGLLSAIIIGMCIGFLPHNWHKAKIFMGDSGAYQLGLLMAISALAVTGQVDAGAVTKNALIPAFIPLLLPLAILILPLLDFSFAVIRRLRAGLSPFEADRRHIHHRLQDFGHSHLGSVLVFYAWTTLISTSFLLVFFYQGWQVATYFVVGLIACLIYTAWPMLVKRLKASKNR